MFFSWFSRLSLLSRFALICNELWHRFLFHLGAFWHHLLHFFVTDLPMDSRLYFLWILDQNGSPKTTPGGSKNSVPLVGFWFASSLATLALKGVVQNLILATWALKRVLQNVILDVVSCIFFPNLFAGRQHRGDTENMDETIQQPRTKGSTLATQHTQTCHTRHLGGFSRQVPPYSGRWTSLTGLPCRRAVDYDVFFWCPELHWFYTDLCIHLDAI